MKKIYVIHRKNFPMSAIERHKSWKFYSDDIMDISLMDISLMDISWIF
jgi:hypothetical protein